MASATITTTTPRGRRGTSVYAPPRHPHGPGICDAKMRLPAWIILIAVMLAHLAYTTEATDYDSSLTAEVCSEREMKFTCTFPTDILVIKDAWLYGVTAKMPDECSVAKHNLQYKKGSFLQFINKQCGGANQCNFSVWNHIPAARSDEDHWKGGVLRVSYICMPKSDFHRTCSSEKHAQSGFLQSIGYPEYYLGDQPCTLSIRVDEGQRIQLTISDISIRDMRDGEKTCTDSVVVREGEHELLHRCGESNKPISVTSEGNLINVTLIATSELYPKRGYIAYWTALGCESPVIPENGFMSQRNATHAEFSCQSQHAFPDTLTKSRSLYCVFGRYWNDTLTDCADLNVLLENGNITETVYFKLVNDTQQATALMYKQAHLVYDLVVPSIIMSVLVVGNIAVVFMIVYCRRDLSSSSSCSELESIKANPEPTDVIDEPTPCNV